VDRPVAGLIKDLRQRGMLDDTLVVFATEFGRTPHAPGDGRDHHCKVFTCWLAGGGVKGGYAHGASDETGSAPAEHPVHVHDFHATILHLLGMDHERLTFRYAGRDFRLTDVHGNVVRDVIA
jgi:arylsulfatase A-like enzyme